MTDLMGAAVSVAEVVEANADEAERIRRLPAATVAALTEAGLMRMCVPGSYGGPEADPLTLVEVIEAVSRSDGAAGWCTMIASTTSSMALFLPPRSAKELFGDPATVAGGVFAPSGVGAADGDGFRVTGRWQWGSGTQHCQWIVGGANCDDGTFRLCFFDAGNVTFHDTWYAAGLRGSGSLDFSVDGALVPVGRTIQPGITTPSIDGPLAAFPNFALLAAGVAAVSLGIGRRALDEVVELAGAKQPLFSSRTLAQSGFTQVEVARAEAGLRAARAFLHDELRRAWDVACGGGRVGLANRVGIRLACVHAAAAAAAATDAAYTLAGGSSVYDANVLQRCLRDVHVTTQHIMVAPKLHETLGKLLLGLDADVTYL